MTNQSPAAMFVDGSRTTANKSADINTFADIVLVGSNILWSGKSNSSPSAAAGLEVMKGAKIEIYGSGSLTAQSSMGRDANYNDGGGGAGIGAGDRYQSGGHIVIRGGTIVANSAYHAAGIGDAWGRHMKLNNTTANDYPNELWNGSLLIYGDANVTSNGGSHGAGIGGACYAGTSSGQSTMLVLPPAVIKAATVPGSGRQLVGGAKTTVYIGDTSTPYVYVQTEDLRKNTEMYLDLTGIDAANGILEDFATGRLDPQRIYFGTTDSSTGILKQHVKIDQEVTIYTEARNPKGYEYVPVRDTKLQAGQTYILMPPTHMPQLEITNNDQIYFLGYDAAEALTKAAKVSAWNGGSDRLENVRFTFPGTNDFEVSDSFQYVSNLNGAGQTDDTMTAAKFSDYTYTKITMRPESEGAIAPVVENGVLFLPYHITFNVPLKTGLAVGDYTGQVRFAADKVEPANTPQKAISATISLEGVVVESLSSASTVIGGNKVQMTAVFNKPVGGLTTAGISISKGSISNIQAVSAVDGRAATWTFDVEATAADMNSGEKAVKVQVLKNAAADERNQKNLNNSNTVTLNYIDNTPTAAFSFANGDKFWQEQASVTVTFTANGSANQSMTVAGGAWNFANLAPYIKVNGVALSDPSFSGSSLDGNVLTIKPSTPFKNNDFTVEIAAGAVWNAEDNKLAATTGTFHVYIPEIVADGSETAGTGDEFGYGLTANPGTLSHEGGKSVLTIHGKYLDYAPAGHLQLVLPDGTKVNPDSVASNGLSATYTATLPRNATENNISHLFTLLIGGVKPHTDSAATVIVKYIVPSVSDLTIAESGGSKGKSVTFTDEGGKVNFFVDGYNLTLIAPLTLQNDGGLVDPAVNIPSGGRQDAASSDELTIPANKSQRDIVYTFELYANGVTTGKTVTVTVKKPAMGVQTIDASPSTWGQAGGTSTVKLTGLHMDVLTSVEVRVHENSGLNHTVDAFDANGGKATFNMTFPAWTGGLRNDIYTLEVYSEGSPTGLTATVEVGDFLPNITGASVKPNYYPSVEATMNGKGRSVITIDGNYLKNFDNIKIYDAIYDTYYTVNKVGCDQTATYTVSVPSAIGVFQYDIWADGADTGFFVQVGVGQEASGELPPDGNVGDPDEDRDTGGNNQPRKGVWAGGGGNGGGGSKGGSFTGRLEVGWEVVEYQANRAGLANPKNPQVTLANIGFFTRKHFDMAASGAKAGAANAETVGDGILTIRFDTSTADNQNKLEGRMYVKLDQPVPDVFPSVYTRDEYTQETRALFEGRFGNANIGVVHLDQNGAFGVAEVEIAASVNLTGMNTTKLYIYRLDRSTGEFVQVTDSRYYIDTAGYFHFFTKVGGDFIITDSPLSENGQTVTKGSFPVENMPKNLSPALQDASLGKTQQDEEK
ncbi:MAG: hypothetical protein ACK5LX_12855 [Oscillospiraceae bacterium]